MVIINPSSGPGTLPYPDSDYTTQIQKLNSFPNVRTIGYVRTDFAKRNITSVLSDVSVYSGWANSPSDGANSNPLALHGIFFDEIPNEYSPETATYLSAINQAVKSSSGLLPARTVSVVSMKLVFTTIKSLRDVLADSLPSQIVHNPGTIPDARFTDPNTDITVVFEGSEQTYQSQQAALTALPYHRSRYSYLVYSIAPSSSKNELRSTVDRLSQRAEFLFLTDLSENYYESFGTLWRDYIDVIPA
jgi:hypothetical protein